ncbi:MAG: ABC transporter permease [Planctomycetes bacterium]|nr:ABC transporter permease [Planctomycetota bacterium]
MIAGDADTVGWWLPTWTLWKREMVRFVRQRSRVIGAFGTPLVFWLIMGYGVGKSLRLPGAAESTHYLEYSFPGAIASILMFTAIFSTISIIDDRKEGFMQGVLAAPVPRTSIALGKVLGATTLAVGQAILFLFFGRAAGIHLHVVTFIASFAVMVIVAFSVTSLGFLIAWQMESTQGFHAVMNLFLMPMLILSGAFFPTSGAAKGMYYLMMLNPMTYGVTLLRAAVYSGGTVPTEGWGTALVVSVAFAAIMFWSLIRTVTRESTQAMH